MTEWSRHMDTLAVVRVLDRDSVQVLLGQLNKEGLEWSGVVLAWWPVLATVAAVGVTLIQLRAQRDNALQVDLADLNKVVVNAPAARRFELPSKRPNAVINGDLDGDAKLQEQAMAYQLMRLNLFERVCMHFGLHRRWHVWDVCPWNWGRRKTRDAWARYVLRSVRERKDLVSFLTDRQGDFDERFIKWVLQDPRKG